MEKGAFAIALLACPIGMGLMGWMMIKSMRGGGDNAPEAEDRDVSTLRDEHRRLGAEIDRLERRDGGHAAGAGR